MSTLTEPPRVKAVMVFFSGERSYLDRVEKSLSRKWGKIDFRSQDFPFNQTTYYAGEMGQGLITRIISFKKLVKRDALPRIKRAAMALEKKNSQKQGNSLRRRVNIDPGLLCLENFILATGKPFNHRIYLGGGVYADLTLVYKKQAGYTDLPWTYPNYQTETIKTILLNIRALYKKQLKP